MSVYKNNEFKEACDRLIQMGNNILKKSEKDKILIKGNENLSKLMDIVNKVENMKYDESDDDKSSEIIGLFIDIHDDGIDVPTDLCKRATFCILKLEMARVLKEKPKTSLKEFAKSFS